MSRKEKNERTHTHILLLLFTVMGLAIVVVLIYNSYQKDGTIGKLVDQNEALSQEVTVHKDSLMDLTLKNQSANLTIQEQKLELKSKSTIVANLRNESKQLQSRVEHLNQELSSLHKQLVDEKFSNDATEREKLEKIYSSLRTELSTLQKKLLAKNDSLNTLVGELQKHQTLLLQYQDSMSTARTLEVRLNNLKREKLVREEIQRLQRYCQVNLETVELLDHKGKGPIHKISHEKNSRWRYTKAIIHMEMDIADSILFKYKYGLVVRDDETGEYLEIREKNPVDPEPGMQAQEFEFNELGTTIIHDNYQDRTSRDYSLCVAILDKGEVFPIYSGIFPIVKDLQVVHSQVESEENKEKQNGKKDPLLKRIFSKK